VGVQSHSSLVLSYLLTCRDTKTDPLELCSNGNIITLSFARRGPALQLGDAGGYSPTRYLILSIRVNKSRFPLYLVLM